MKAVTTSEPRRGRPLDEEASQSILVAALELLLERGYGAMSVEAVAARAGVGKPAIYRRHRDKAELTAAAVRTIVPSIDLPDTGDTRTDLRELARQALPMTRGPFAVLLGNMLAEAERQPELIHAFREGILWPRREVLKTVVRRGMQRGEVRPDVDPEQAADVFGGQVVARHIAGLPFTEEWTDAALEFFWRGLRAR